MTIKKIFEAKLRQTANYLRLININIENKNINDNKKDI